MMERVWGIVANMEAVNRNQKKDIRLIGKFVEVYCAGRHHGAGPTDIVLPAGLGKRRLCPGCAVFLQYAIRKRLNCPLEAEKPTCKHCRIHCYATLEREKMREIMSYAGRKLMMRGRLDYLWHYFF